MNLSSIHLVSVGCVQAIAFRKPVPDRSFVQQVSGSDGAIGSMEYSVGATAARRIVDDPIAIFAAHLRVEIRQVIKGAGCPDGGKIGSVEAEKIDARLAAVGHVRADVQL